MFDWTELEALSRQAAEVDPRALTEDERTSATLLLERVRRFVDASEAHLLAALDADGTTEAEFGLVTGTWLAREADLPSGVARSRVRVAKALHSDLDVVDQRLTAGEITWEHARVIADAFRNPRVTVGIVAAQADLLDDGDGLVFDQWRTRVAGFVDQLDQDGGFDPNDDLQRTRLHLRDGLDHSVHLDGLLAGADAETVRQAVESMADELFRQFRRDHERCSEIAIPKRAALRAMALAELVRRGLGIDLASTKSPRADVSLVVRADDLATGCNLDGVRLADGTTRLLCCDARWHPIIVDSLGVPLDLGRELRFANRAQRRAAAVRDGGCVFPGCTAPVTWTDMHHLILVEHGGRTDLAVMACLCRRHHGITHRKGWRMFASDDPEPWFYWVTPNGRRFWSQRHRRQRTGPPPPPIPLVRGPDGTTPVNGPPPKVRVRA